MPKRKSKGGPVALPQDSSSDDECDAIAASVISRQQDQQKKRRMRSHQPGARTKTSVWTTIAATKVESDKPMFQCCVCDSMVGTNHSFSSSNVTLHYKSKHKDTHDALLHLNGANATEEILSSTITEARDAWRKKASRQSIMSFFRPSRETPQQTTSVARESTPVPAKLLQSVAVVLYACATETPFVRVASPITQGLVDIFGGRMQPSSKEAIESHLHLVYSAVCGLLKQSCTSAVTGSISLDGWSAALGTPILGVTWSFIDDAWRLRSVPISMLNIGGVPKTAEQLRSIVTEILKHSLVVGSENIRIHTITSDNEPATALACDLLTNFVGSVRCVVHSLALCVNDVFAEGSAWQQYMNHVNKITSYLNYHSRANVMLLERQKQSDGITNDRLQRLNHDVPTRWHSRLGAMLKYLSQLDNIAKVADELNIPPSEVPRLSNEERTTLSDFIKVLAEVRRVARQLEADTKVTMSRAPRLLRELYETMLILGGLMERNQDGYYSTQLSLSGDVGVDSEMLENAPTSHATIPSVAAHCKAKDDARMEMLCKSKAKQLALKIAESLEARLGDIWNPVEASVISWSPEDDEEPPTSVKAPRRILLFHLAAVLDVNECELEFLRLNKMDRESYFTKLHDAVAREAIEIGGAGPFERTQLQTMFSMFHLSMREELKKHGRREPSHALLFWKKMNSEVTYISPVPFNKVARACLSSQASSASAERLFSNLGRMEGRERQSMLSSTLEMTEMIRVFVYSRVEDIRNKPKGLLHVKAAAFKAVVEQVASEVVRNRSENK